MGRREVHVVVVGKRTTLVLLVVISLFIVWLFSSLAGRAYSPEEEPIVRALLRAMHHQQPLTRIAVLSDLMPIAANILLFLPWGFLAFILVDSPERTLSQSYALAVLLGAIFATALNLWQDFLPVRVTGPFDALANVAGTFAGAIAGHVRKRIRFQFDY